MINCRETNNTICNINLLINRQVTSIVTNIIEYAESKNINLGAVEFRGLWHLVQAQIDLTFSETLLRIGMKEVKDKRNKV